jgi:hypothetical protein
VEDGSIVRLLDSASEFAAITFGLGASGLAALESTGRSEDVADGPVFSGAASEEETTV